MAKFKVGDIVRRVSYPLKACPIGYEAKVVDLSGSVVWYVDSEGDCVNGSPEHWEMANAASPIRTVTRKEIVPGSYGTIGIGGTENNHVRVGFVGAMERYVGLAAKDLREAAALFTSLADVLDENAKAA